MKDSRRVDPSLIILILIFLILVGLGLYILFSMKIDDYKEMVNDNKMISIVLIIEDEGKPIVTELFYYHPETRKGALLNLPEDTGTIIRSLNRVDRIDTVYQPRNSGEYLKQVAALTGIHPDFHLIINTTTFVRMIDYLEGVEIFLSNPVDNRSEDHLVLLPSGSVTLDGDKSLDYLRYEQEGESVSDRIRREHELVLGILRKLNQLYNPIFAENMMTYLLPDIETDMDQNSFGSFLSELSSLEVDRMVFQEVLGTRRMVDNQLLLFPHYDGKLLKETVKQMEDSLSNFDVLRDEKLIVSLEIQNGTTRNGLAGRTAEIFKSYGYQIASVKNADTSKYENTVILDKKGDPAAAQRVANLIKCTRIHTEVDRNRDETVDIIVILGKDFDGRYVK
jgi:polyisoprenyl-teichoic acid--peptidoglycan teichoic acid transferase